MPDTDPVAVLTDTPHAIAEAIVAAAGRTAHGTAPIHTITNDLAKHLAKHLPNLPEWYAGYQAAQEDAQDASGSMSAPETGSAVPGVPAALTGHRILTEATRVAEQASGTRMVYAGLMRLVQAGWQIIPPAETDAEQDTRPILDPTLPAEEYHRRYTARFHNADDDRFGDYGPSRGPR